MLSRYFLKMPSAVYSGKDAISQMKTIIPVHNRKVAVFTDKGIENSGILEKPLAVLREMGKTVILFDQLAPEPTCDQVQAVIDEFRDCGAEYIVAIGGGSVMDTAKLASILVTDQYSVRDLLEHPEWGHKQIPSLMIPTTAGTGSEATPNSIVAVPEKELKVGIVNPEMIADAVILDADMTGRLPRKIAAATGVDALAHAIECFTSKKANCFSDMLALEALDLIMNHIEDACEQPENEKARTAMLIGAFYAGAAITASGTTAVHALSYPLGGKYHIPHGVANAMLLVPVLRFNCMACSERLAAVYDRVTHQEGNLTGEKEKADWVIARIGSIVRHLDIPENVKEFGVPEEDLEKLVAAGMQVQRLLANNMRMVTAEDARKLYLEIL